MTKATELLHIEGLSAGYGEAVVLHDIALRLNEGETLALLGRNGTGKTTLMDTLVGVTTQHGGHITFGGVALHHMAPHERAAAGIGWVPQERNIFKSLTVHENLTAVACEHDTASTGLGRPRACTSCSHVWPSAKTTWAHNSQAANNKCWRWVELWC